jgi:hypothetical protein
MNSSLRIALISTLLTTHSFAVPKELATTAEGRGNVERGGRRIDSDRVNLKLKDDGDFSLSFVGDDTTRFKGSWKAIDNDSVFLNVKKTEDKDSDAQGQVDLQFRNGSYTIRSVKIAGSQRGVPVTARWSAERAPVIQPPIIVQPPIPLVQSTRAGRGRFEMEGTRPYRLTHAYAQLFDTGRVFVNVYGDVNLGYVGTWRSAGPDTVRLDVRGGFANERISGVLNVNGRTFSNITLSGTTDGTYYKVEFDVR